MARSLEVNNIDYLIIDLSYDSEEFIYEQIDKYAVRFIGISMISYYVNNTYELIKRIKNYNNKIKIIAGGSHTTVVMDNIFTECSYIDISVIGEGEVTLVEILKGKELKNISGIIYKANKKII